MKVRLWMKVIFSMGLLLAACLPGRAQPQNSPILQTGDKPYRVYMPQVSKQELPPPSVPLPSDSYYMTTLDSQTVYQLGCDLGKRDLSLPGKQDSVVVLHFGYPRQDEQGRFGTRMYFPATPATVDQIAQAVETFGYGYWYCVGADFDSHLRIAVGTSNYPGTNRSSVTYQHGRAWAQMVNAINAWFRDPNTCTRGCDGQVDAVGANDLELSWNAYTPSADWLNGYDSANNFPMYNFGALPGCPYLRSPNATCGGGGYIWTREQVWYVIWGSSPVFPLPEIYRTDGVNAEQWYLMSVYSYVQHGQKIEFIGPMSQFQACQQRGGCNTIDNRPEQAWQQLYNLLNGDPRTSGERLPYLTDILWLGE